MISIHGYTAFVAVACLPTSTYRTLKEEFASECENLRRLEASLKIRKSLFRLQERLEFGQIVWIEFRDGPIGLLSIQYLEFSTVLPR